MQRWISAEIRCLATYVPFAEIGKYVARRHVLPDTERSLFTLYLTNLSYQEIAEVAGISEPTLRVRISRLKSQFEKRYL